MNGRVQLTIQTPLQNRGKKTKPSVTTDAQHNMSFRKLILGVIEEAADSQCSALPLTSSQPPTPHHSLCLLWPWQGKFRGMRQFGEWKSRGTRLWLLPPEPQLERFNQPLGRVGAWGGAKSEPSQGQDLGEGRG